MKRRLLYLGPDLADVAVTRRVHGFREAGVDVVAFAYERSRGPAAGFESLGPLEDGRIRKRVGSILQTLRLLRAELPRIGHIDAIYARNLDLALVALLLRRAFRRHVPLIYEVLDIHLLLSGQGVKSRAARALERRVLNSSDGLVISSPSFLHNYFEPVQHYHRRHFLVENKVEGLDPSARPEEDAARRDGRMTIVLGGKLRCARSLQLLRELALARPEYVRIRLAGAPNADVQSEFSRLVALPNVENLGRYTYPSGLAQVYSGADLNWTIDFQSDFNSRQLIPNRLYEGGYFSVPPLVRAETATAMKAADWGVGVTLSEPYLPSLLQTVDRCKAQLAEQRRALHRLPASEFVATNDYARLSEFIFSPTAS